MKTQSRSYALSSLHPEQMLVARTITPQEVVVVNWDTQSEEGRFRGRVGTVLALTLHPDGHLVAVAGDDDKVEVWDAQGPKLLASCSGKVTGMRFSPDGNLLLMGQPGSLIAWDWASQKEVWKRQEALFQNPAILDCHQEQVLWSAMGAANLEVLDLKSGETVHRWVTCDEFMAATFHPDGRRVAAAVNTVRSPLLHQFVLLKIGEDLPEREFPIPFMSVSVAVSPGGGTVATGDARGVQLWDMASGAPEGRLAPRVETKVKDFGSVEVASAFLVSALRFLDRGKALVSDGDKFCHWTITQKSPNWTYPA